jgi:hypothetical protein
VPSHHSLCKYSCANVFQISREGETNELMLLECRALVLDVYQDQDAYEFLLSTHNPVESLHSRLSCGAEEMYPSVDAMSASDNCRWHSTSVPLLRKPLSLPALLASSHPDYVFQCCNENSTILYHTLSMFPWPIANFQNCKSELVNMIQCTYGSLHL